MNIWGSNIELYAHDTIHHVDQLTIGMHIKSITH